MTSISQSIWNHVKQEGMALSYMAKHHSHKVNSKMIRHLTLSALVLASIPTSAVFVSANETITNNHDSEVAVQKFIYREDPDPDEDNTATTGSSSGGQATNSSSSDTTNIHYVSIKGSNTKSDSNYNNDMAKTDGSIVIGESSYVGVVSAGVAHANGTVIGSSSWINGYAKNALVVGYNSYVDGNAESYAADNSIVLGNSSAARSDNNIVIGNKSKTVPGTDNAILIGNNISLDYYQLTQNDSAIIGNNITAQGHHNSILATDYSYGYISDNAGGQLDTHVAGDYNTVIGSGNLVGYDATWDSANKKWTYKERYEERDGNVVIGETNTSHGNSTVIIGTNSEARNLDFSFGTDNHVNNEKIPNQSGIYHYGQYSLALGGHLMSNGDESIAIGSYGVAKGDHAIAIGGGTASYYEDENGTSHVVKDKNGNIVSDGVNAEGNEAIAMGYKTKATGDYAMAFGSGSSAASQAMALGASSNATMKNAIALGYQASSTVEGGIALGANSKADVAKGVVGFDPDNWNGTVSFDPKSSVWKSTLGAISVGSRTGETRQITNVAAGTEDTDAVNVAQLKRAIKDSEDDREEIKARLTTEEGKTGTDTKIKDVSLTYDKESKNLKFTLTQTDDSNPITGNVKLDGILSADSGLTQDTRNTVAAGDHVTIQEGIGENGFGGIEYKISVNTDGKVEENNTGLVSGGMVYNETRVAEDGNYVKKENTTGANLTALDTQVKQNADSIISLGDTVYDLSNRVGEMDDRINKVGAGAAALAALHPLDYDPEDKWDIAAGFGNYKNASAGALGLFYRPNERTQFNVGWTMGDDRNMFNAGFSVKLGQGSSYAGYSKADMAQLITKQKDEIAALQATIGEQEKEIQQIEEKMNALMARLEKNK